MTLSEGYVSAYYYGTFYPVCADQWSEAWSSGICWYLSTSTVLSVTTVPLDQATYVSVLSSEFNITQLTLTNECSTRTGVSLVCLEAPCGQSNPIVQPFIVGGDIAAENAWPWAAVLLYKGRYQCTASLIGSDWLLTAAHCFFSGYTAQPLNVVAHYFAVRLGSVLSRGYSQYLRVASVRRIVIHPDYIVQVSTNMRYNDVALVQLGNDLLTPATTISNSRVSPVCLPDNQHHSLAVLKTWQCYVIGWGLSNIDGQSESELSFFAIFTLQTTEMWTNRSRRPLHHNVTRIVFFRDD